MSGRPLVAVVTPVYNGAPYFERTVACVQAQTYDNIVHVILDNASTDNTPDVLARARKGRVPIKTARNDVLLPQMDNFNKAMSLVPIEARYVKWLCADDLMRADAVEKLTACAEASRDIDLVLALEAVGGRLAPNGLDPHRTLYAGRDIARMCLKGQSRTHPWTQLFFRVTPERLTNPFHHARYPAADVDFAMRELMCHAVGIVNEPLYFMRQSTTSVTSQEGGVGAFVAGHLERVMLYGPRLLSRRELALARRLGINDVARWMLRWRFNGQYDKMAKAERKLAALGITLGPLNYIDALWCWPFAKLDARKHHPDSCEVIPENAFLASTRSQQVSPGARAGPARHDGV